MERYKHTADGKLVLENPWAVGARVKKLLDRSAIVIRPGTLGTIIETPSSWRRPVYSDFVWVLWDGVGGEASRKFRYLPSRGSLELI